MISPYGRTLTGVVKGVVIFLVKGVVMVVVTEFLIGVLIGVVESVYGRMRA